MYHHRAFLPDEILQYLVQFLSRLNFSIMVICVSCHYVELKLHLCQQCVWVRCPVTAAQCFSLYWNDSDALGVQPPGSKLGSLWSLGVMLWRPQTNEKRRCNLRVLMRETGSHVGSGLTEVCGWPCYSWIWLQVIRKRQSVCSKLFTRLMSPPSGRVLYSTYMQTHSILQDSVWDELCIQEQNFFCYKS